jgi:hypothetical protein
MRLTSILVLGAAAATLAATRTAGPHTRAPTQITVYHSPTCGCCKKWITYLQANGFTVKSIEQEDLSEIKAVSGVTARLASCHTALVQGYVIEGHVPAADIKRLLSERPKIVGLTAPGMPGAGPGMDIGKDPYDVLAFDTRGTTSVWAHH